MSEIIDLLRKHGVECYTRAEWGSPMEAQGYYAKRAQTHPMPPGPARYHFLHITVTSDTDTVQEGKAGARQIERYGYSTPPMVSYQDLITNEGRYYEGQNYGTKGTHTVNDLKVPGFPENLNLYGYALALMQNVGDEVTDEQVRLAAMVFAAREILGLVVRGAPIYPHRKFANKACPGDKAVARLAEIQRLKEQYVRDGLPGSINEEEEVAAEDIVKEFLRTKLTTFDRDSSGNRIQRQIGTILVQTHYRADQARSAALQANRGVSGLASMIQADPGASEEVKSLAREVASATAQEVARVEAAALTERLEAEITFSVKEE